MAIPAFSRFVSLHPYELWVQAQGEPTAHFDSRWSTATLADEIRKQRGGVIWFGGVKLEGKELDYAINAETELRKRQLESKAAAYMGMGGVGALVGKVI